MSLVTCTNCGWVHMLLSREEAQASVDQFNAYFEELSWEQRYEYYNNHQASIQDYMHCFCCGSTEPMRKYRPGDCPDCVTLQPTILGPLSGSDSLDLLNSAQPTDPEHSPE